MDNPEEAQSESISQDVERPKQHHKYVQALTPRHQHERILLPSQLSTCNVSLPPSAGSEQPPADRPDALSRTAPIMMMSAASHMINHPVAHAFKLPVLQTSLRGLSVCSQDRWLIRGSVIMPQDGAGLCLIIQVPGLVQPAIFSAPGIEHPVHARQFLSTSLSRDFPQKELHQMCAVIAPASAVRLTAETPPYGGLGHTQQECTLPGCPPCPERTLRSAGTARRGPTVGPVSLNQESFWSMWTTSVSLGTVPSESPGPPAFLTWTGSPEELASA